MDRFRNMKELYLYYIIIFSVSIIALIFFPAVGSTIGLEWNVPNTPTGWVVWIAIRICVACINVLLFYSFMQQAKINIKDNEYYKKGLEILYKADIKTKKPRSPEQFNKQQWAGKGVFIFLGSLAATVALTQAILSYDYIAFITYLFTILMGIIFGFIQMKVTENYYIDEFYKYAIMIEKEIKENAINKG